MMNGCLRRMEMKNWHVSNRKATAYANGAFLVTLGALALLNAWWPWILIAIWVNLFLRQYLTHRFFDAIVSSILILGFVLLTQVPNTKTYLVPVLFFTGGIYLIVREYFFAEDTNGEETSKAIEEDTDLDD